MEVTGVCRQISLPNTPQKGNRWLPHSLQRWSRPSYILWVLIIRSALSYGVNVVVSYGMAAANKVPFMHFRKQNILVSVFQSQFWKILFTLIYWFWPNGPTTLIVCALLKQPIILPSLDYFTLLAWARTVIAGGTACESSTCQGISCYSELNLIIHLGYKLCYIFVLLYSSW